MIGQQAIDLEVTPAAIAHSVIENCFWNHEKEEFVPHVQLATHFVGRTERMKGIKRINELHPGSVERPKLLIFHYMPQQVNAQA